MRQKLGQRRAQSGVYALRAQAAAHHQQNRLIGGKVRHGQPLFAAAGKQLGPQRRAGEHALGGQRLCAFGEGGGYFFGKARADLIGQAGGEIAFMAQHGHAVQPCAHNHRHGYEPALGEAHVGLEPAHQVRALERAGNHAEGIGEVLPVKVAAQLAGFDHMIGHARQIAYHAVLDAILRADVVHLVPFL